MDMSERSNLDRAAVKAMIPELEKQVKLLALSMGMEGQVEGNFKFDPSSVSFKVKLVLKKVGFPSQEKVWEDGWNTLCRQHGSLNYALLGQTFPLKDHQYKVVGAKPDASKYPVLAKRVSDGKVYKFPLSTVVNAFATA